MHAGWSLALRQGLVPKTCSFCPALWMAAQLPAGSVRRETSIQNPSRNMKSLMEASGRCSIPPHALPCHVVASADGPHLALLSLPACSVFPAVHGASKGE